MGWEDAPIVENAPKWMTAPEVEPTSGGRASALMGGVNRGVAGLIGLPVDTAENIYNLAKAGVGSAAVASGRPDLAPEITTGTPGGSESIIALLNRLGIKTENPQPEDPASRMLHTGGVIAGGSMVPGASPRGALAAATGGAVASEALGPQYTGIGALVPAAGGTTLANVKNSIASRTAPTLDIFRQAGTTPSVGQATDNTFLHGLENLAAKFPGGSGIMKDFIERQQRQMGMQARTGVPAEAAGRAIESGIKGESGFLERTNNTWQALDAKMASKIPQDYKFPPLATAQVLDDLTLPTKGAEATTSRLINPKLVEMRDALLTDIQNGKGEIPFTAIRELRSKVGSMLEDSLVSGIPNGELKQVYKALSKDIEGAAKGAGAGDEWRLQNDYYRARMDRVETVLNRVIGKNKQPEDIFKTVMPTEPDQANKLRAVLRSLKPDEREIVSEAVANRLGRESPTRQDEMGSIFSSERFLTNWNKLSPGAKAQLFPDPPLRENLEKLAKASASIREGKGIYANPSGTAGSFAAYSIYSSPIVSFATGNLSPMVAASGAAGGAYLGAKMLTSPKIVEWLATPIKPGSPQAAAHLTRLGTIYNQSSPELKQEIAKFIQSTQPNTQSEPSMGMNGARG